MILYTLRCSHDHHFEQWFSNSAEYDSMKAEGGLACPECGDKDVAKAIMAPNVKGAPAAAPAPAPAACTPGGCGMCQFAGQH
ncbi:DUF1178 family protein [Magnetospirillum sp. UT-4]|uniref:DUF1178 family protein n=1 Tax=Magnetospirillum sp. UT-4 TaxID=2681467 RepID=UPI0013811B24|nr:DUF1178 family protein [Magnetospirillum sp. UT-4]CAA7624543.1 conserved hypothetical protein [Magnetospirillum sp. UT-4]